MQLGLRPDEKIAKKSDHLLPQNAIDTSSS